MKRYFKSQEDRIVIVDSTDESDFDRCDDEEISESDLPECFDNWAVYQSYGTGRGTVKIMSERGD